MDISNTGMGMIVRKVKENELREVLALWFEISVRAHHFIPSDFWERNRHAMATEYLPCAETHVAFGEKEIIGFISMVENYLAAVFVRPHLQGMGVGKRLLAHVKDARHSIQLRVYKGNWSSVEFYLKQDFVILSEGVEEETGEVEYLMEWKRQK